MDISSLVGAQLGKYQIHTEIGRGGMGIVYKGYDPSLDRSVAIKVLPPHLAWEQGFVARFLREARAAGRLRHPNIVTIYEVGQEGGWYYFAMEYLEGQTLAQFIWQRGPLPVEEALHILHPLAEALDYAHGQGLIHRDIKPGNVIVGPDGHVTLTDFGIARAAQETRLTRTGEIVGTPEYMSPEQARGGQIDRRSDQYALGVVAYEMLTGRVPFQAESTPALLHKVVYEPVPPPCSLCPGLPQAVEAALLRMLAKAPADRFPSACAFAEQLQEALLAERQAARLAPLYAQLQAAATRQEWAEVLALGGRIQELDPAYRDVAEWMGRARDHLRRPPRRPPRVRLAWLWPVVGGAAALLLVVGVAVVVFQGGLGPAPTSRPTWTPAPSTATPRPTDTRVPPTATSRPTPTPVPPTATPRPVETPTPVRPPAEADIGDTWTRPADGMVMVYVPAGEFLMGSSDADSPEDNEKPQHTVYLDAYWIDRTEVTNAQYRKCVEAGACREPGCWGEEDYNAPDQPVVCVSWDDAQAYAAWVGGRLPTEAEWEKAARGTEGRIYPWGYTFDGTRLNYCDRNCDDASEDTSTDDGYALTAPVGRYPAGASPYGALDMAGNVWEWVADWYDEGYYARSPARNPQGPDSGEYRVVRGGTFHGGAWGVRCAVRYWIGLFSLDRYRLRGFRLVASPVGL